MIRFLSCLTLALALFAGASFAPAPAVAQAQQLAHSKAVAPVLDDVLKHAIQAMDVMNESAMPGLQDQALVVAFFAQRAAGSQKMG